MRYVLSSACFGILALLCALMPAHGQRMTSTNYAIFSDVVSYGGVTTSTSNNYTIGSSLGEFFAFNVTSTNRGVQGGFWQTVGAGALSLTVDTAAVNLGNLSRDAVSSAAQVATVNSESGGYSLTISEDGNLRSGGNDIDDVSDGEVSIGSEEYGIRTSGAQGLFNATDSSITGGQTTIASSAGAISGSATTITYKASISAGTADGSYSHTVTLSAVGSI